MRCEGNGRPCHQDALCDPPLCPYHYKLIRGLLTDSEGRYHAAPAKRPSLPVPEGRWEPADWELYQLLARESWPAWTPL